MLGTGAVTISSNHMLIAADMPDDGSSVFPVVLVIDEAAGVNWEGGASAFIDALEADYSDLQVTQADGVTPVAFGVAQFSQVAGSRKLIIHLGAPTLNSAVATEYMLHAGVAGGPHEDKAAVAPAADDWQMYVPFEEASGNRDNWVSDNVLEPQGAVAQAAGKIGYGVSGGDIGDDYFQLNPVIDVWAKKRTILAWLNAGAGSGECAIVYRPSGYDFFHIYDRPSDPKLRFIIGGVGSGYLSGIPLGEWVLAVGRYQAPGVVNTYGDAQSICYKADGTKLTGPVQETWRDHGFRGIHRAMKNLDGSGDELRVVDRWLSDDWIATTHNAEADNDTFWTVGEFVSAAARYPAARRSRIYRLGPRLTHMGVI